MREIIEHIKVDPTPNALNLLVSREQTFSIVPPLMEIFALLSALLVLRYVSTDCAMAVPFQQGSSRPTRSWLCRQSRSGRMANISRVDSRP